MENMGCRVLLRSMESRSGLTGILCPDDSRTDENHTEYLSDERMRVYDSEVYDTMKSLAFRKDKTVQMVENSGIFEGMFFCHELLDLDSIHWSERAEKRAVWHQGALKALSDAEMIFADPGNSLIVTKNPSQKGSEKHIFPNEVMDYYKREKRCPILPP